MALAPKSKLQKIIEMQNFRNFSAENYILATVGALLVAASSLKLVVPVILIVFTLLLGWRKLQRNAVVLSAPILVFASYQYLQIVLRPESFEYYADLPKVYLVILFVAVPYVNMLLTRPISMKTLEVSVLLGAWVTMIFWVLYQLSYEHTCRIEPFGINALFIPITILPITYYFIALRIKEERHNIFDSLIVAATVFCVASYTGSRMPLYTLMFAIVCILGNLTYYNKAKFAGLIFLSVVVALMLALIKDSVSGCYLFQRITNQLDTISPIQAVAFMSVALFFVAVIFFTKKITNSLNLQFIFLLFFGLAVLMVKLIYMGDVFISDAEYSLSSALVSSEDSSVWTRWSFYTNSLSFLTSGEWNWVYGNGALAEGEIVNKGATEAFSFTHAHNQFLSWLIAGGVLGLCSGLLLADQLWRQIFSDLPSFIFLVVLGLPFLTNSPMYNAPITAQLLFLMLTMQVISFVRHGKSSIL